MTPRHPSSGPHHLAALALALGLAACGDKGVLAVVGKTQVRRADLDAYLGGRSRAVDARSALEALVERTAVAEAGRRAGILDDPAVKARIASSEREIVAQAFIETQLAGAGREDGLRKRYAEEKDRLARKQIHVAQIAVHTGGGGAAARAAAQAKASRLYARLAGGEAFEKVAREGSDDPVSGARGGDLGVVKEGEVDAAFFAAAAALKRGEISKPFETAFGFHIVKALEDPLNVTPPYEEIRGLLAAEARREAEGRLLARVKEEIPVKVYADRLPAGSPARPPKDGEGK